MVDRNVGLKEVFGTPESNAQITPRQLIDRIKTAYPKAVVPLKTEDGKETLLFPLTPGQGRAIYVNEYGIFHVDTGIRIGADDIDPQALADYVSHQAEIPQHKVQTDLSGTKGSETGIRATLLLSLDEEKLGYVPCTITQFPIGDVDYQKAFWDKTLNSNARSNILGRSISNVSEYKRIKEIRKQFLKGHPDNQAQATPAK